MAFKNEAVYANITYLLVSSKTVVKSVSVFSALGKLPFA